MGTDHGLFEGNIPWSLPWKNLEKGRKPSVITSVPANLGNEYIPDRVYTIRTNLRLVFEIIPFILKI